MHSPFPKSTKGAALVEYAALAALVGGVALFAVLSFGGSLQEVFATADGGLASTTHNTQGGDGTPTTQPVPAAYTDPYFLSMPTLVTAPGTVSSGELMTYQYGPGDLALNTGYAAYWRSQADWAVMSSTPEADAFGTHSVDATTGDMAFAGPWLTYCSTGPNPYADGTVLVQGNLPSGEIREIVYTLTASPRTC